MNEQQTIELFGDKEARWFQIAVRNQVYQALCEGHRRICVIQPTGSGKTISSGLILTSDDIRDFLGVADNEPLRVLFASHRHRLLTQAEATYAVEENIEIIPHSIMSQLPDDLHFHLVVMDECHHEATLSFQMQLERVSRAPLIGLTATIDRADGRLCKFSKFIEPITREQAVRQGFLAESFIHTFAMAPTANQIESVSLMLDLAAPLMGQTMGFMRTKQEAMALHEHCKRLDIKSRLLVDISEAQLNRELRAFEDQEYQIAWSCMKLGEGVDVKGCRSVINGRRTRSRGLLNQLIGRASRNDSDCYIWESINPLSSDNLDATQIVGVPKEHHFWYQVRGEWRTHRLI